MDLTLAYSPCPNDTFMFHDIATGTLRPRGVTVQIHLHDVETLNRAALAGRFDITKLSFAAWLQARSEYTLLNAGAALGYGCGPVVVARRPMDAAALAGCRVAIPGELTTAHLLLRLWQPSIGQRVFVRYDEVIGLVAAGEVDAGVIIHEGRFVYQQAGLHLVVDLGRWWEQRTSLPIPLGCIAARTSLGPERIGEFEALLARAIRNSVAALDLSSLAGKSVYLDSTWFAGVDRQFALGELREAMLRAGARLVPDREAALLVAEPRSARPDKRSRSRRAAASSAWACAI